MNLMKKVLLGLAALFRKQKLDREMDEEMRFHIDLRTQVNIDAGMRPDEARYAALRQFGWMDSLKEACREQRGVSWIENVIREVRFGGRRLARSPGFTLVAVLTLAVGIGANTAIFSFVDRVLLRSLPVSKPHELVQVGFQTDSGQIDASFNYPLYLSYRDEAQVFSGLIAFALEKLKLAIDGEDVGLVESMPVSGNYFSVLGVKPARGRALLPEDDAAAQPVVVISHRFWRRQFGGQPTVIGRSITVNGYPHTIVGVLRRDFMGTIVGVLPDIYLPIKTWASTHNHDLANRSLVWWSLLGRIKLDLTRGQAQAALRLLAERIHAVEPNNTHRNVLLWEASRGLTGAALWPLMLLFLMTVLLLLIACANVANMLLVRATTRQKEIAVRLALGAARRDVIRQLLSESTLLGLWGGVCGVGLACGLSRVLESVFPVITGAVSASIDGRILIFALFVTLATTVLFGLAPAVQLSKPQLLVELKEGASERLRRGWSFRDFLVVAQMAVAMVMLVLGGLCLRSLALFRGIDPGFDSAKVLAVRADFLGRNYCAAGDRLFFDQLRERIAALPQVKAVSLANEIPLSVSGWMTGIKRIEQYDIAPDEKPAWNFGVVSPGYFQTLGVPLLQGRDFSTQDGPGAPKVMLVNDLLAQRYWPNQDPIGKRVTFYGFLGKEKDATRQVIGVVKTVKLRSILDRPKPLMYCPLAQLESSPANWSPVVLARSERQTKRLISAIRSELLAAGLPPAYYDIRTITDRQAALVLPQRSVAQILTGLGLVGLWLVTLGVYGVIAYAASQRTREIGIRMALGARVTDVLGLVVRRGTALTTLGVGLGLGLSLVAARWLEPALPTIQKWRRSFLYGVELWDPLTYLATASLLLLIALAACWIPARRAAKVDPVVALRYE